MTSKRVRRSVHVTHSRKAPTVTRDIITRVAHAWVIEGAAAVTIAQRERISASQVQTIVEGRSGGSAWVDAVAQLIAEGHDMEAGFRCRRERLRVPMLSDSVMMPWERCLSGGRPYREAIR